ncbi:MAG: hypothetical protein ACRD3G_12205 [Vicinamibacterales bacterium]
MSDEALNDGFNRVLRMVQDHPGALRSSSRVDIEDFVGRAETWNVDTVRVEGATVIFLQRSRRSARRGRHSATATRCVARERRGERWRC